MATRSGPSSRRRASASVGAACGGARRGRGAVQQLRDGVGQCRLSHGAPGVAGTAERGAVPDSSSRSRVPGRPASRPPAPAAWAPARAASLRPPPGRPATDRCMAGGPVLELVAQLPLGQPQRVAGVLVDGERHLVEVPAGRGLGQLAQVRRAACGAPASRTSARAHERQCEARRARGRGSPTSGTARWLAVASRTDRHEDARRGRPAAARASTDWSPSGRGGGSTSTGPAARRRGPSVARPTGVEVEALGDVGGDLARPRGSCVRTWSTIAAATSRRSHASTSGHVSSGSPRSMTSSTSQQRRRGSGRCRSCSMSDTRSGPRGRQDLLPGRGRRGQLLGPPGASARLGHHPRCLLRPGEPRHAPPRSGWPNSATTARTSSAALRAARVLAGLTTSVASQVTSGRKPDSSTSSSSCSGCSRR